MERSEQLDYELDDELARTRLMANIARLSGIMWTEPDQVKALSEAYCQVVAAVAAKRALQVAEAELM